MKEPLKIEEKENRNLFSITLAVAILVSGR